MEGYGKIYRQIFKSSIAANYEVRHIFMDLCLLCDREGNIDMTYEAIARETGVPLEKVIATIKELMQEDFESRSKREGGARLALIDANRPWGWRIINHSYYRGLESRRNYWRDWKRKKRAEEKAQKDGQSGQDLSKPVQACPSVSKSVQECPSPSKNHIGETGVDFPRFPHNQTQRQRQTNTPEGECGTVDIDQAKVSLALLSKDHFGQTFEWQHWSTYSEDLVRRARVTQQDLDLLTWFYGLPEDHPFFNGEKRVTRRRQSFEALLENLASEVQKVRRVRKITGLPEELEHDERNGDEEEERTRRRREKREAWTPERMQATRELFPEMVAAEGTAAGPPAKFTDLDDDLRARIEARVKENEQKNDSGAAAA